MLQSAWHVQGPSNCFACNNTLPARTVFARLQQCFIWHDGRSVEWNAPCLKKTVVHCARAYACVTDAAPVCFHSCTVYLSHQRAKLQPQPVQQPSKGTYQLVDVVAEALTRRKFFGPANPVVFVEHYATKQKVIGHARLP